MDEKRVNTAIARPSEVTEIAVVLLLYALPLAMPGLAYVAMLFVYTGYPPTLFCVAGALLLPAFAQVTIAIQFYRLKPWTYPIARLWVSPWGGLAFALGLGTKIRSAPVRHAFGLQPSSEDKPDSKVDTRH